MSYRTSRSFDSQAFKQRLMKERYELLVHVRTLQKRVDEIEAEAFSLAAGVCEFRSGNEHDNAMCLATGDLIEMMKKAGTRLVVPERQRHALNCAARVGGNCTCDYKSTFGK